MGAPAAAEGGEAQVEGGAEQNAPEPAADWQQSVDQQLSSAADGIRQMAEMNRTILSRLPEPQQEQAPDFEAQFNDLFEQGGGYVDPGQLQQLVSQQAESIAQNMIAPLQQQLGQFQQQMTAQEFAGIQSEFPELADQKAADHLADSVVNTALSLGLPPEIADGLMQNPNFVRQVHLAEKARSRGQQETPAGQGQTPPQIETGGGAAPGSASEGDEWDRIANAGRTGSGPIW